MLLFLFDAGEAPPEILCQAFGLFFKKDAETVERGCQYDLGLEHAPRERWLRDLGLLSLEKMGNVVADCNSLKCSYRDG